MFAKGPTPEVKLTFDESKIFILRRINGVLHKVWTDKDGNQRIDPVDEERKDNG